MKRKRDNKEQDASSICRFCLFQTGIVFLGVFAPALGRNVLKRGDGSSFARGR